MRQHFRIIGTGSDLPGEPISAAEMERRAALPAGWIAEHTQVAFRHACVPPESLASLARRAVQRALESARLSWAEIDLILDGSTSRHQPIPCNAAMLQSAFGLEAAGIPSFDVHGTCLGFLLATNVANSLLATGAYRRILIVCSESTLTAANWKEPDSATLLGDGAAAVILERAETDARWSFQHQTFAQFRGDCEVRGGGHDFPASNYSPDCDAEFRFHMDGPKLLKTALSLLPSLVDELIVAAGVNRSDLLVIPHQASPRAVELLRRRLRFRDDQFINRAGRTGNLASASIPLLIDQLQREGRWKSQPTLLLGTSAGYSQAGMIFTP